MKISLHRALAEIKLLDKRINSSVKGKLYVTSQIGREKPRDFNSTEEFEAIAKGSYQSVMDLISRRNEIKSKLIHANAVTEVTISGERMTIAEAIDRKDSIKYEKLFLLELKNQLAIVNKIIEQERFDMELRLENRIESDLGSKDRKINAKEVEEITESFLKRYKPSIIDPLDIRKKIELLEESIENFETEVDYVLSEINTVTTFELKD